MSLLVSSQVAAAFTAVITGHSARLGRPWTVASVLSAQTVQLLLNVMSLPSMEHGLVGSCRMNEFLEYLHSNAESATLY